MQVLFLVQGLQQRSNRQAEGTVPSTHNIQRGHKISASSLCLPTITPTPWLKIPLDEARELVHAAL